MIRTLSGFLGLPSDWDFLPWPHSATEGEVLMGYSMGGRLALRMLEEQWNEPLTRPSATLSPQAGRGISTRSFSPLGGEKVREARMRGDAVFKKAVIISAGLNAPDEARRARDEAWARRFETEDWSSLMRDWNAQPVFGGHVVARREEDFDRAELARQLRELSPAVLPPPRLESIATPVLWVAGERDAKYVEIAKRAVERLPHAELWICPDAGHRVPWEQPEALVGRLRLFLDLH